MTTDVREAVTTTQGLPCGDWEFLKSGKVAETYVTPEGNLAVVRTDRVSAFDVVMPTPIPDRGKVLSQMSAFWCERTAHIVPNHLVMELRPQDAPHPDFIGRTMVVERLQPVKVEAIVRGYVYGSAWSSYRKGERVPGLRLPKGIQQAQKLEQPAFTPSTKAEEEYGELHDAPLNLEGMVRAIRKKHGLGRNVGRALANKIKQVSLDLYSFASDLAEERGIIVCDTKFEFGLTPGWEKASSQTIGNHLVLIDEVFTPDSSRFWWDRDYTVGAEIPSLDKQQLREWLERLVAEGKWNKEAPGPELPEELVSHVRAIYIEAFEALTGQILQ